MGAAGKAYTFVQRDQGDELTKVEALINMVIPVATLEGFQASPTPADWKEFKPGFEPTTPSKPVVSRFERPYGASTATAPSPAATGASEPGTLGASPAPVALPRRTIGSKIPITRRHKRRR
jgi:hypothetical protein